MAKRSLLFTIIMTALLAAGSSAHPLGNFSVNQYSRLEISMSRIKLHEVLDMAEIPTFQESAAIDIDGDGAMTQQEVDAYASAITAQYAKNLQLALNGQAVLVRPLSADAVLAVGAANIPTLRITWDMIAELPPAGDTNRLTFQNNNYADRAGWNEIVVNPSAGVSVFDSSSYADGASGELKYYSEESITSPLSERTSELSFRAGTPPKDAKPLKNRDGHTAGTVQKDKFAELISVPEITPLVAMFGLLAAFGLGAIHAMSPGHGKTVVGAYLVGSRGTAKHALFLGLTVTITHTLGVFALGLVTLFASSYVLPERIMPFLSFVSGLLVFFIGISLFKERLLSALGWNKPDAHTHRDHTHPDGEIPHTHDGIEHTHGGTTHSHAPPESITWKGLLALGISGGLLPCPSALVLMLSAISLGRTGYGLVLTVVFSFGLAATLTVIGLLFLYIGSAVDKTSFSNNRVIKALPVLSAFVVAFVGAMICYQSLA